MLPPPGMILLGRTLGDAGTSLTEALAIPSAIHQKRIAREPLVLPFAGKPPYHVPTMAEIATLPWNGYRVVSTFSGGGGSCLGYRMAGYRVVWANEFIPAACETYRANHPDTVLDSRDIRTVTGAQIRRAAGLNATDEIDLLDGSPPCAAFSSAGIRDAGWGKEKVYSDGTQRVDDLFFEFARLLRELQPRTFIAENVSGLVRGRARGYFVAILRALKECGYAVEARLLDAQWLGVPQVRKRLIFVGVRHDLVARYGVHPVHPAPLPYRYSVREALPYVRLLKLAGDPNRWREATRPSGTIVQQGARVSIRGFFSCNFRETFTGERARWTIDEVRALCAFPADYILTGTFGEQWERMGRAVPPLMMARIASTVQREILDHAHA